MAAEFPDVGDEINDGWTVVGLTGVERHLAVVLANRGDEWATWLYNRDAGGCCGRGNYFHPDDNLGESGQLAPRMAAAEDYSDRLSSRMVYYCEL